MTHIEESLIDPSLNDGGEIVFDSEIPLAVRIGESSETEVLQVRFKITTIMQNREVEQVRMEMSSDNDLFFLYKKIMDQKQFQKIHDSNGLKITLDEFPTVLGEMLTSSKEGSREFDVIFTQDSDVHGTLEISQELRFKTVPIFSIDFEPASDEYVKDQIQYRFNYLKAELKSARTELSDLYAMLKIKNPSVLKHMKPPRK